MGEGPSTLASQKVTALLFHQGSDRGRPRPMPCWGRAISFSPPGEEAALLLNPPEALMGGLGMTAGRASPPGSTVILQDAAELYSKRQFPGRDTAMCRICVAPFGCVCRSEPYAQGMLQVPLRSRSNPPHTHSICSCRRRNTLSTLSNTFGDEWREQVGTVCCGACGAGGS